MEENSLQAGVCAVSHLNHLEAEVLPDSVPNATSNWNNESHKHCSDECIGCIRLRAHKPGNKADQEQGPKDILGSQEEAYGAEFGEVPFVCSEDTLQEGISVIWVLLDIMLDVGLEVFGLVADFQTIW